MILEEALERVPVGGSIEQLIWTPTPEGIEPQDGVEYRIKVTITKTGDTTYQLSQHILAERYRE